MQAPERGKNRHKTVMWLFKNQHAKHPTRLRHFHTAASSPPPHTTHRQQPSDLATDGRPWVPVSARSVNIFKTVSRPALGSIQPTIQSAPGSFQGTERPGREATHSYRPATEIKNQWSYISTALYVCMVRCNLTSLKCELRHKRSVTARRYLLQQSPHTTDVCY